MAACFRFRMKANIQPPKLRLGLSCAVAVFVLVRPCAAHPDLIDQINQLTTQLKAQGESADGLEQRAELYRRHGQFEMALIDIAAAERLATNSTTLILVKARIFCDAGMAQPAFATIQKFLRNETNHAEGLSIRARCEARLKQPDAAIADYTTAIKLFPAPMVDLYLERARQQALLGKLDDAVCGLDEAMNQSSPLPVLQMTAIEYDRQRGAFDSALRRVDGFVNQYPVKEPWLTLCAEILEQAGRKREATETFQQVITGIEKYSTVRRGLELTKQLEARARQGFARAQILTTTPPKL